MRFHFAINEGFFSTSGLTHPLAGVVPTANSTRVLHATVPMSRKSSAVHPMQCGAAIRVACFVKGVLASSTGSAAKQSSAAPANLPEPSASSNAVSSTMPPRAVLSKYDLPWVVQNRDDTVCANKQVHVDTDIVSTAHADTRDILIPLVQCQLQVTTAGRQGKQARTHPS